MENAQDFLDFTFIIYPGQPGNINLSESMETLNNGKWKDFLDFLKNMLSIKTNRQYLIGDHMTLADITIGSIFMALIYNPYLMPAQQGLIQTLQ